MRDEKILYLECRSGISGDMTVAALLDLGADEGKLRAALDSLPLAGYEIHISRVKKSGLNACDFAVRLDGAHENHDHDMAYLHGDPGGYANGKAVHICGTDVHGCEEAACGSHHHPHEHRGLPEIRRIIEEGALTPGAKQTAFRIFDILADAEAKAHGVPREQVHFHEVGAVDSIVDIVAAAVCLDDLAPDCIVVSPLSEGNGTVRCQHGILPIPVPAVANIVSAHGLPIHRTAVEGEMVTPTGAAIAAAIMQEQYVLPDDYTIKGIGIGAGKRDYATAGILRAMWIAPAEKAGHCGPKDAEKAACGAPGASGAPGEAGAVSGRDGCAGTQEVQAADCIVKLEANIDDATGEELGHCLECLMEAGAKDASFVPVYMKKNRPAYEVHVICMPRDVSRMEAILFRETTTIGIRRVWMERTLMEREFRQVDTVYGTAQVKVCRYGDIQRIYPEYDRVVELCRAAGQDYRKVYRTIVNSAEKSS